MENTTGLREAVSVGTRPISRNIRWLVAFGGKATLAPRALSRPRARATGLAGAGFRAVADRATDALRKAARYWCGGSWVARRKS
jgi:hypothetical protein